MNCTHPDHIDGTDCLDRAVACAPDCTCCLLPVNIEFYAKKFAKTCPGCGAEDRELAAVEDGGPFLCGECLNKQEAV